jgi:hypothetical protein
MFDNISEVRFVLWIGKHLYLPADVKHFLVTHIRGFSFRVVTPLIYSKDINEDLSYRA